MKTSSNRYMATCVPGMETVAEVEIKETIQQANNVYSTRGKVIFDCHSAATAYNELKCVDNVYKLYRIFHIGNHADDLSKIDKYISDIDFDMAGMGPYKIVVSASRSGKHTYSRFDIARHIENCLTAGKKYISGNNEDHDLSVRIDVIDDLCYVCKKLTPSELRFRGGNLQTVRGGLRPSIAHSLVRLSRPDKSDVFYDPFCGAGTIPYDRSYYKHKRIYASDIDENIVEIARENVKQSAIVYKADAAKTSMKDCSVNAVVTNMPWGKQVRVANLNNLYYDFFKELKRILTDDGRAIFLTDQLLLINDACNKNGLKLTNILNMSLHGLHPSVFMITK